MNWLKARADGSDDIIPAERYGRDDERKRLAPVDDATRRVREAILYVFYIQVYTRYGITSFL